MIARTLIAILLLSGFNLAFGQDNTASQYGRIRVKVLDAESNQPIPYANVYLNQTTIGGYTDDQGEVEVTRIPFGSHQLVVSELGHKLLQRTLIITSERPVHMTIILLPRVLEEVQVRAKRDDKWQRQFNRFQRLFFGSDHYKQCTITNPWVLEFKTAQGDFIAEAKEPLKIENNYLGYNLDFYIKNCFFNADKFVITGIVRFEEKNGDEKIMDEWKKNREYMYRGSPQHFLRAVVNTSVTKRGYDIYRDITGNEKIFRNSSLYSSIGHSITPDSIGRVNQTSEGIYEIGFPDRLEVHYRRKRAKPVAYLDAYHAISWMEVKNGTLKVSRNGIVQNPESLTVAGMMSDLKVAGWLPLNFESQDENIGEPVIVPIEKKMALLEKPYVQTDRNYYYSGESIWLKGYMSYAVPLLKDTLSQSIYLELVDATGKVVVTKRYHVDEGKFSGDILLDKNLKTGPYQLKAYTAWMLNFDTRLIFTKTINLLGEKEAVRIASDYKIPADTLPNISLQTDKATYSPREKVVVTIDVLDSLGFSTASDLSISVTDFDQAVPPGNEKTILTNFLYDEIPGDSAQIKYNIEFGIAFNGRFWLGKKPVQGSITVFQENSKHTWAIITNDAGQFQRSLSFNDTVNFYLSAMDANNRKGKVVMDTLRPVPPALALEPSDVDIYSADDIKHVRSLNLNSATLLKEVVITEKKIEERPRPAVIHGQGDYTVTGDWINERNYTDIFLALAAKVPGLRYDPNTGTLTLSTSQFSSIGGSGPMFLIDGQVVNDVAQVLDIPIRSIDYVDVLKFGASASYGSRGAGGVIAIFTKNSKPRDPNDRSFDKSKLQEVKWGGYSSTNAFIAPDYSRPSNNDYFDYRATIFWSPSVKTDGKAPAAVSFYAADAVTKYRIVVEGVSAQGTPVRAEKIIEIVKER